VEREYGVKHSAFKYILHFLEFNFPNMIFPSTLYLFFIFFGTGFEVLTVVRIHNAVWVRTPFCLIHGYECFGGAFWINLHRKSEDGGSMP
jgi:hypothetical protein